MILNSIEFLAGLQLHFTMQWFTKCMDGRIENKDDSN